MAFDHQGSPWAYGNNISCNTSGGSFTFSPLALFDQLFDN